MGQVSRMAETAKEFGYEDALAQQPPLSTTKASQIEPAPEAVDIDDLRTELAAVSRHLHADAAASDHVEISRTGKLFYMTLGGFCVAFGTIGVFVPGLPTTIFMIVALWAFTRSSARMRDWLYNHRHFGPALQSWVKHRSIPTSARQIALASLLISALFIGYTFSGLACLAFILFVCAPVASFLWTLPADVDH